MLLSTGSFFGLNNGQQGGLDFSFIEGVNASSTTFAMDFGDEDPDRYLLLALEGSNSSGFSRTLPSLTIGGVAATGILGAPQAGSAGHHTGLWIAPVPTGLSGNVVITTSGYNRFCAAIYRAVGLVSTTPHDSGGGASNITGAVALDIPAGGAGIGFGGKFNGTPFTLSGVPTDFTGVSGLADMVSGHKVSVAGETVNVDVSENLSNLTVWAASFL